MLYQFHQKTPSTLSIAQEAYPWMFLDPYLSDESREVRYWALEYLRKTYQYYGQLPVDPAWWILPLEMPDKKTLYLSLSHSEHYVAFACDVRSIGIDIAEYSIRDESLLSLQSNAEYSLLGGKNWRNFYILWTAKEAIIKITHATLDDMKHISLVENLWDTLIFWFLDKIYKIYYQVQDSVFISYWSLYESL